MENEILEILKSMQNDMKSIQNEQLEFKKEVLTRFDEVNTRFEEVNTRFEEVNTRFDDVNTRFDDVNTRFDEVNTRFEEVNTRFDKVETKVNKNTLLLEDMKDNIKLLAEGQETIINQIGRESKENNKTINDRLEIVELATSNISKDLKLIATKLTEKDIFNINDHLTIK